VNPDLIAAGLSPFRPERAAVQAGRLMLARIFSLGSQRRDFAFETTLAGRMYASFFCGLKKRGYRISVFYLWIPSPELALKRIVARVAAGGHDVPRAAVFRRFKRSLRNLFTQYWKIADNIFLFDNSSVAPRLIASKQGNALRVADAPLFERIKEEVADEKQK
jgi:predicted ABC-type ATPase